MQRRVGSIVITALVVLGGFFVQVETAQASHAFLAPDFNVNPYDRQAAEQVGKLQSPSALVRAGAAEALGFMRAYSAADALVRSLDDESADVRRQAAMALAWCGARGHVKPLLAALDDGDWVVRQAAWVALNNITGAEWPFNALGKPQGRARQVRFWNQWWADVPEDRAPDDVTALVKSDNIEQRLRGVRALGALGGKGAGEMLLDLAAEFADIDYRKAESTQKNVIQCTLRSLGRLREPQALPLLIDLLEAENLARYAADALGDFGDVRAVMPLIAAHPRYSRNLSNRTKNPDSCPSDDRFSGDNTQDRMHETPYAIAQALSRLPLDNPEHAAALRRIAPNLVANMPTSWDSGVFYEIEAAQLITAYLLERAGIRQTVCDIAFAAADKLSDRRNVEIPEGLTPEQTIAKLALRMYGDVPDIATWLPAFCRQNDVARLMNVLEHDNGWIRINAAKALMFLGDKRAITPLGKLLAKSVPEARWGYSGVLEHAEYNDPAPRWREAYIRALGRLGAVQYEALLVNILEDARNVVDIRHAAATALDELGTENALAALKRADADHPFYSVRLVAREALWRRGLLKPQSISAEPTFASTHAPTPVAPTTGPEAIVFIKGNNKVRSDFNGQAGVDPWRQAYTITNSGPVMRVGRNLYTLRPARLAGKATPLTNFKSGFVADCEVSWDGRKIIFSRRLNDDERNYSRVKYEKAVLKKPGEPLWGGADDPWWHVWEINADGTGLHQITHGPYHDVNPAYLPDGRIVFSSSRLGMRDEYHGFPCIGLSVMNADGSDIHQIGFNLGGDRDPAVMDDGRIVFSRIDLFYSRLKTEVAVHTVFPDGTRNESLYGPERRAFWIDVHRTNAAWSMRGAYGGSTDNRNRVLRLSQPQPLGRGRIVCSSSGGLVIAGPGRYEERLIPHDRKMAVTSPFPLSEGELLCAATVKRFKVKDRIVTAGTKEFETLNKGPALFRSAIDIDLALYTMNTETGEMSLLYNDPATADFEARPIMPRPRPIRLSEKSETRSGEYTARLFCNSARSSRHSRVTTRGKFVRIIEGQPIISRHETQQNRPTNRWKNHGGTHARVLGTVPLAADGSFFVEVPADRLLHLQVLDADRYVLGNQTFWMYARPGETRSCVGCHENRNNTHLPNHFAPTAKIPPIKVLPSGDEFSYRAKAWLKGILPDEAEARTRTVRAVNLIGRH